MIDIGVNLTDKQFNRDREAVVERAVAAGVNTLILTGTDMDESIAALELAQQYPEHCYSTAGIHPHSAKEATDSSYKTLSSLFQEQTVVAAGEMGLDFNRDFSPRPVQETVFEQQLALAVQHNMPAFCHERDASQRFFDIVREFRDELSGLVVHCFTADKEALYRYLDLDLHIGITGWVCDERRGTHLHPLLRDIPKNRLMIETDAPWLLPRTMDKKPKNRRNEPAFLPWVARTIAEHTGETAEQVMQETAETARLFFNLDQGEQ
ncbi:preprotein translocase subunit TatD [Endozoicomonas montiporae]|uniref:Preprotein translocase subunit TatD n=2 Tax=Endozoicomonas montiporae TaxID=1027273 RepID=A0A081NB21_9GAMM|nr:TatD family hydrolase [Endozoicomonas montiporae]AMO56649.1 preprotein translocase subunit TatD [Endozoicomonas montiporae CL-33]KEQ15644.1 preprotein translocase subunit TatD [Endozoicomonas montiporae]